MSVCLYVSMSVCLSVCLFACLSVCLLVFLFLSVLSVRPASTVTQIDSSTPVQDSVAFCLTSDICKTNLISKYISVWKSLKGATSRLLVCMHIVVCVVCRCQHCLHGKQSTWVSTSTYNEVSADALLCTHYIYIPRIL